MGEYISPSMNSTTEEVSSQSGSFHHAGLLALIAGIFFLPMFFIPTLDVEMSKNVLLSVSVFGAFLAWILGSMKRGVIALPKSALLVAAFALVVATSFSAAFSDTPSASFLGVGNETMTGAMIVVFVLLLALSSFYFQERNRILYLYVALLISAGLLAVLQTVWIVLASLGVLSTETFSFAPSVFTGRWTDLAALYGLLLVLSLTALEFFSFSGRTKTALIASVVFSLLWLAFAGFPLLWIVTGVFALIILAYAFSHSGGGVSPEGIGAHRKLPTASLIVVTVLFVFLVGNGVLEQVRANIVPLPSAAETTRPSWPSTFSVARTSLSENVLFGSGPNRFVNGWLKTKNNEINQTPLWNTDFNVGVGTIPTLAAEGGVLTILALAVFLLLFLARGITAIFSPTAGLRSRFLLLSSFVGALYVWTIAIFFIPRTTVLAFAFLLTGVFIAALVSSGITKQREISFFRDPRTGFASVLFLVLAMLGSVAGGFILFERFFSLALFERGIYAAVRGDMDRSAILTARAASLSQSDIYYRALSTQNIARLSGILEKGSEATEAARIQFQDESRFALGNALRARDIDPGNYQNWVALGDVYAVLSSVGVENAYAEAVKAYEEAMMRNPKSPALLLARAKLDAAQNPEKAKTHLRKALEMKGDYTDAIFFLSQIEANEGNISGAIQAAEAASQLAPQSIGVFFHLGFLRYQNRDWGGAIRAFERAIELAPEYSNARYFLGLSYDKLGRRRDAIGQFERTAQLNPGNTEVAAILKNLRAGRDPFVGEEVTSPERRDTPPLRDR